MNEFRSNVQQQYMTALYRMSRNTCIISPEAAVKTTIVLQNTHLFLYFLSLIIFYLFILAYKILNFQCFILPQKIRHAPKRHNK
jgi:hypothetical protein